MSQTISALVAGFCLSVAGCGAGRAKLSDTPETALELEAKSPVGEREPQWQDALADHPAILVSLRPTALRTDRIYGPLLRKAFGLARMRSRVVAGTRVIEAMEEADEVIVGLSLTAAPEADSSRADDPASPSGDMVAIVRGVRSDLDPGALVDGEGHTLWSPGPNGRVRELIHERDADGVPNPASLFELPGRTWVIASGGARARARDAFARPLGRPEPWLDPEALAVVRLDGPSLVSSIPSLQPAASLASIGDGLQALEIELLPGTDHELRAIVSYADEKSAAASDRTLHAMKDAVTRKRPAALAWLATATVERTPTASATRSVRLVASLSPELVEVWLGGGAEKGRVASP